MVSDPSTRTGRRRRLSPSEKNEVFTMVLTGQATQVQAVFIAALQAEGLLEAAERARQGTTPPTAATAETDSHTTDEALVQRGFAVCERQPLHRPALRLTRSRGPRRFLPAHELDAGKVGRQQRRVCFTDRTGAI